MSYDNIKLWFAKCEDGTIKYIDEINDENKHNTYRCPMCNSNLIPKATKSVNVSSHFAHMDISKCTPESMIHWWFKNKFIEPGDSFTIVSEKEVKYICKELLVEQSYTVNERIYRPDVTVITECGKTIYFEMNYSNKKSVKDYLDVWIELKNIVVEIDVKSLMARGEVPKFKALFYDGKCFNVKKNDVYYNTIGKYKEEKLNGVIDDELKERMKKLDWFWEDVLRYKKGEVDISSILTIFESIYEGREQDVVFKILSASSCIHIMRDCVEHALNNSYLEITKYIDKNGMPNEKLNIQKEIIYNKRTKRYAGGIYVNKMYYKRYSSGIKEYHEVIDRNCIVNKKSINKIINQLKNNNKASINKPILLAYNSKAKRIKNSILNNKKFRKINKLAKSRNYRLEINVKRFNNDDILKINSKNYKTNSFDIDFSLLLKNEIIKELSLTIQRSEEIESSCEEMAINFYENLKDKRYIKNIARYRNLIKDICADTMKFKLGVYGSHYEDDIYRINIVSNNDTFSIRKVYFINSDKKIFKDLKSVNDGNCVFSFENIQESKRYIVEDIEKEIGCLSDINCFECNNKFKIPEKELMFFIEKNFDLPKRCKPCRKKRKAERLVK